MLYSRLSPAKDRIFLQKILPACNTTSKLFLNQNKLFVIRLASTRSTLYNNRSKPDNVSLNGDAKKPKRRFVKVDSEFSKANKFTYVMPQDPYVASDRVTSILKNGSVDDAIEYIKALPLDLQSVVVWNHLIGYCAQQGKAKFAEQSYVQMRRRGIAPNDRTFTHMISVYSKSTTPNAVENAEEWLKKMKNFDIKPSIIHINNLLKVYNHAQQPSKTIKLLHEMPSRRIHPDAFTYSIALKACSELSEPGQAAKEIKQIWQNIVYRLEGEDHGDSLKIENLNLKIDDGLVISLLTAISRTLSKESDMIPGLEAIHRLYSLYPPRAAAVIEKHQLFNVNQQYGFGMQPSIKALDTILRFCGKTKQYALGKEYYELALQQYPRLKPDQYVNDAYDWIKRMTKRRPKKEVYNKKNA
ncbi:hypothetical protein G6F43_008519 [Rhizopus delemar]|nr:hypothetical protein G6F43_008519 [Rhizopus delemar]